MGGRGWRGICPNLKIERFHPRENPPRPEFLAFLEKSSQISGFFFSCALYFASFLVGMSLFLEEILPPEGFFSVPLDIPFALLVNALVQIITTRFNNPRGPPRWPSDKESARRKGCRFDSGLGRSPGEGNGNPILAWEIPRIEEPGGLQSVGLQRARHDLATKQ